MGAAPVHLLTAGPDVRAAYGGPLRGGWHGPVAYLQQSVRGPMLVRSGRARADGLGRREQLGKPAVPPDPEGSRRHRSAACRRDADRADVARPAVDGTPPTAVHGTAAPAAAGNTFVSPSVGAAADRATSEPQVDAVRLENLWCTRLEARGWSRAASNYIFTGELGEQHTRNI